MKRTSLRIFLGALALLVLFWGGSLLRCEVLTHRYGQEFQRAWADHTMIGEQAQCKVLAYTDTYARIYVVEEGRNSGNLLEFTKAEDSTRWDFQSWETVWSATGSADGFLWPYIR